MLMGLFPDGFREELNAPPYWKTAVKHSAGDLTMKSKHSKPAVMGYRDGGKVKGFMPCAACKAPKACKAAGMCMAKAKR